MYQNAKWIMPPGSVGARAVTFRRDFSLAYEVESASLCVTSIGVYKAEINGARVGTEVLAPGITSYFNRVQYQSYDVKDFLQKDNILALSVAPGWAVGAYGYNGNGKSYADHVAVLASLHIVYKSGKEEYIFTDESFEAWTNAVTFSDLYNGETVDLTEEPRKIGEAVLSDVAFPPVLQVGERIVENERLRPIRLIVTPKGERVLDFGQNLTGHVELKIRGKRGDRVVFHHAEVLDCDGNFYTANLRSAKNECTYILSGGEDLCKPTYSFQGFRYIRLTEYPFEEVFLDGFRAIVVHSEMKRTGYFETGNPKLRQLYHNTLWGQKSNYLDIPTDCPQRDERLGWTGDAQVFVRTAAIQYDVEKFFRKWLGDMALEQGAGGEVLGIVPDCFAKMSYSTRVSAAWGDAACIIPWELYMAYGNKELLREHFPMMKKWVEYQHSAGPEEYLWLGGYHYGDWLAMDAGEDSYLGVTSCDLIGSAFFAYSCSLLVKAGEVLGEDVTAYRDLYRRVRAAFRDYFMENGMPKQTLPIVKTGKKVNEVNCGMTQTAITLILHFGLCEEEEREALAARLAELIRENDGLMATGFVGTPYLLHALSENGYVKEAYDLLLEERNPSWLYSVNRGATTVWEHWNGIKEDGSFWSTDMNSFNHYAYGSVFDWVYGVAVGIKPTAPAYRTVALTPHPDRRLGYADAKIKTRSGDVRLYWYYKDDIVFYEIEVPNGVKASLTLPSGYTETLSGGVYHFAE